MGWRNFLFIFPFCRKFHENPGQSPTAFVSVITFCDVLFEFCTQYSIIYTNIYTKEGGKP